MIAKLMSRVFKKMGKEEKGFTLIELLAVIVILAVIAVIAVPMIGNIISKSKTDADVATARQIYDAARLYVIGEEGGDFSEVTSIPIVGAAGTDSLTGKGYLDSTIALPSNKEPITGGAVNFSGGVLSDLTIETKSNPSGKAIKYTAEQVMTQEVKIETPPTENTDPK